MNPCQLKNLPNRVQARRNPVPEQNLGQNIVLYKSYYLYDDEEKRDVLRHEFVHARQQSKYGVGGGREELNMADIEAEANANAGEESEYWFDAPIFY